MGTRSMKRTLTLTEQDAETANLAKPDGQALLDKLERCEACKRFKHKCHCFVDHVAEEIIKKRERKATYGTYQPPKPTTKIHGPLSSYATGCRCQDCTLKNREYQRVMREKRKANSLIPKDIKNHGQGGYVYGCRCKTCVESRKKSRRKGPKVY